MDDIKKIRTISKIITNLFYSAKDISSVVEDDMSKEGFTIQYIKRGNILQPIITITSTEEIDSPERDSDDKENSKS